MMFHRSSGRKARGFTLIELLVAITILAIVAVLGWRGLDGIVRARIGLTEQLDQTRGMQLAFAQLQSDCAHVATTAAIGNRTPFQAEPERLMMIRSVSAENQPTRMQVVAYRLQNGALTRQESLPTRDLIELDAVWQAMLNNTATTPAIALESGITLMTMRVWLSNAQSSVPVQGVTTAASLVAASGTGVVQRNPLNPTLAAPSVSGLEMALRLSNTQVDILKIFLLGTV